MLKAIRKIDFLEVYSTLNDIEVKLYSLSKFPTNTTIASTMHSDFIRSNVLVLEKKDGAKKKWIE